MKKQNFNITLLRWKSYTIDNQLYTRCFFSFFYKKVKNPRSININSNIIISASEGICLR
jgi:hypothetical protein